MKLTLSTIADICGIIGFIISLFAIGGVVNINKRIKSNNIKVKNTHIGGDFTGGDNNTKNKND